MGSLTLSVDGLPDLVQMLFNVVTIHDSRHTKCCRLRISDDSAQRLMTSRSNQTLGGALHPRKVGGSRARSLFSL